MTNVTPALTITGPAGNATYGVLAGQSVTLSGTLESAPCDPSWSTPSDGIAGAAVTITRTGPGGTVTQTATTGADGSYALTDTPAAPGSYTYTASYAGSATATAATGAAPVTLTVAKATPALSVSVSPGSATYQPVVHVTVHLGATDGDRTVSVYARTAGSTRQALLTTATVNSAGNLALSFAAAHTTTFSAVYAGDADYTARTATATASVAAAVTIKTGGYYASKHTGALTYRLYHRASRLLATATVAPNKHGESVKFEVQKLYKGKWYPALTGGGKLNTQSIAGTYFALSHDNLGSQYRIRADYEPGSDTSNLSADSAWQYYIVEK